MKKKHLFLFIISCMSIFKLSAQSDFDLGITYVTDDLVLPVSTDNGATISWKSSKTSLITTGGKVTRPAIGTGNQTVTLTATIKSGKQSSKKSFKVTVAEADFGYLLTYILKGNTERTNSLYIACSENGTSYTPLNTGKAIKYATTGSKKMASPSIFRKPNGTFGLIASDNNSSNFVTVFHSDSLITYTDEHAINLSTDIKVQNPVCKYDNSIKAYRIQWKGSNGKYYENITSDLKTASSPVEITTYSKPSVLGTLPENAIEASRIGLTKAEYSRVIRKFDKIKNTGIAPIADVRVKKGTSAFDLPENVTALYNDGSAKTMGVTWSQSDIDAVDTNKSGTYTIAGTVGQPTYANPFIERRADPHIVKGDDGYYYFTASYPMVGSKDPEGYDRVILRRSSTVEGLASAEEIAVWNEKDSDISFRYVWAPEIHNINGTWYVLFTTSNSKNNVWGIRPIVIACNQGEKDPMNPDCWEKVGHYCKPVEGDNVAFSGFSLDMTYFENNGTHYVAWAEKPNTSNIMIASIDPDRPWILTSKSVLLSVPEFAWEWKGGIWVNEGPAVIKNKDMVYLAFSAASVDESYCVGILYIQKDADLLNAKAWTKIPYPLLASEDLVQQVGPGHNSFTVDEFGNPLIVYHARTTGEVCGPGDKGNGGLYDPGRHARIKSVNFAIDGIPVLNLTPEEELNPNYRKVTVKVTVK